MPKNNYEALIPDRIFVGGVDAINKIEEKEAIDVIYDLRKTVNGELPSDKSIHKPIIEDEKSVREAVQAVMNDYHAGKNVYFHCNTGRGRGGTIATAILMELNEASSVDEAEEKVKSIRSSTNVRPAFKEVLKNLYEK